MFTPFFRPRRIVPVMLAGSLLALSGCGDNLTRTFGLTRDAPDEYTVTTRAPLSMPPDYALRPPRPGAARPQEQSERQQAEETLVPQLALGGAPKGDTSPGQQALDQQAGPAAPADIRRAIDRDASRVDANESFIDKVLYWRKPNTAQAQVDAQKESQRLRQNAALGEAPNVGDTPIIQQRQTGWFTNLFSWL